MSKRTSSALLGRGCSSTLAAIFCLRLLLLAARAGFSALVSLTSLEADRLAVGVLPRDAREVDAMPSALVGGVGEARELLLSMAGELVQRPAPAMEERNGCPECPHEPHVVTLTLGCVVGGSRKRMHALPRVAALAAWPPGGESAFVYGPLTGIRPPHFQRQPRTFVRPTTSSAFLNMHANHGPGLDTFSSLALLCLHESTSTSQRLPCSRGTARFSFAHMVFAGILINLTIT